MPAGDAPAPIPGSNTYFGQRQEQRGLFIAPSNDERQNAFQAKLASGLDRLQRLNTSGIDGPVDVITRGLVAQIQGIRRSKALGFLPDQQHWRLLEEMLDHDMFTVGAVSGRLTIAFLALADRKEMMERVMALNGLSAESSRKGLGAFSDTDPQVRNSPFQTTRSPAAD